MMKKIILMIFCLFLVRGLEAGWTIVNTGTVSALTSLSLPTSQVFYGAGHNTSDYAGELYKSTNGGTNWFNVALPSLFYYPQTMMFFNESNGIIAGNTILLTSNGGTNWTMLYGSNDTLIWFGMDKAGDASVAFWAVGVKRIGAAFNPAIVRCANLNAGVRVFTRIYLPASMSEYQPTSVKVIDSNTCYVSISGHPVFDGVIKTTNGGVNWLQSSTGTEVWDFNLQNGIGIAAAGTNDNAYIYKTTNDGNSWTTEYSGTSGALKKIAWTSSGVFAVGNNGAIVRGYGDGTGFVPLVSGTTSDLNSIASVPGNNNFLYAVGENGILLKTTNGGVGVNNISSSVPDKNYLYQNYPNPFNPSTTIKFDLQSSSDVTLTIFDALGREVATLVNEKLNAGVYTASWNGINYTSGIYFYTLKTNTFTDTGKMLMIK